MGLKIIGSGFGRTGTMSTKLALEQLGFGPCHNMVEVMGNPQPDPVGNERDCRLVSCVEARQTPTTATW